MIGIIGVETVTSTFTLYRRFLVVNYLLIRMLNRKNSRTSKPSTTITSDVVKSGAKEQEKKKGGKDSEKNAPNEQFQFGPTNVRV